MVDIHPLDDRFDGVVADLPEEAPSDAARVRGPHKFASQPSHSEAALLIVDTTNSGEYYIQIHIFIFFLQIFKKNRF